MYKIFQDFSAHFILNYSRVKLVYSQWKRFDFVFVLRTSQLIEKNYRNVGRKIPNSNIIWVMNLNVIDVGCVDERQTHLNDVSVVFSTVFYYHSSWKFDYIFSNSLEQNWTNFYISRIVDVCSAKSLLLLVELRCFPIKTDSFISIFCESKWRIHDIKQLNKTKWYESNAKSLYLFAEQKVEVKFSTYANRMILFSAKLAHK